MVQLQDQRNVRAFTPHFIHTRGRTVLQMESPVWEEVLEHGRGSPTWADSPSAGTVGEGQKQESFAR